jgi:hypothetical protein
MRGKIIHVTWVGGLQGILRDQQILPNPAGTLNHSASGALPNCYACQKLGGVSVLDLKSADEHDLFDRERIQHWSGVFSYYHPAIALFLRDESVENGLIPWLELRKMPEKSVLGEACHRENIPLSAVTEGVVIGAAYRIIYSSSNLRSVLLRAQQVSCFSRRSRKNRWKIFMPAAPDKLESPGWHKKSSPRASPKLKQAKANSLRLLNSKSFSKICRRRHKESLIFRMSLVTSAPTKLQRLAINSRTSTASMPAARMACRPRSVSS